jgi:hypothetical protein
MKNNFDFASEKPVVDPPPILDSEKIKVRGPWTTKSNAKLTVLNAFPHFMVERYLRHDENEAMEIPQDIRGLRLYHVRGLKKDSVGGKEFHRIRKEFFFGLEGVVDIELEDLYGDTKKYVLDVETGVYIPNFILHTYKTREDNSGILAVANTLFFPEDPRTHDTYTEKVFRKLQKIYKK